MEETRRIAIGALATHTGANIETIRYYERVGLFPLPLGAPEATAYTGRITSSG